LLLADADTGYGNAINVHHTVRAFERAGVAGLMLEDQVWPKRCGHLKGKEVISAEEMVQKIRAAAEARVDPDFVIKSRTDVLATHGVAEAIRRLNLYAEAGADLLIADAAISDLSTPVTACALRGMKNGLHLLQQSLASGKVVDRPDALVSFEELHDIMGMHEIEEMEQRYLTPEQLEAKYGRGRKASMIMPGAKGNEPPKPGAKSKQTA